MPELTHNFVKGRMNKDLDERIVPNGEYRDALNIKVSTSEESGVGTIQNLIGNVKIEHLNPRDGFGGEVADEYLYSENANCIATVSDEKNNRLFFFTRDTRSFIEILDTEINKADWDYTCIKDQIIEYNHASSFGINTAPSGSLRSVFIDNHTTVARIHDAAVFQANWVNNKFVIKVPTPFAFNNPNGVKVGMNAVVFEPSMGNTSLHTVIDVSTQPGGPAGFWVEVTLDSQPSAASLDPTSTVITFVAPKVLFPWGELNEGQWNNRRITGINVIDDLLFWTDNIGEPKKINIKDSKEGTQYDTTFGYFGPTLLNHKGLINHASLPAPTLLNISTPMPLAQAVEEENITVIRKSPKTAPTLDLFTERDATKNYSGLCKITLDPVASTNTSSILDENGDPHPNNYDFSSIDVGDILYLRIETDLAGNDDFELNEWNTLGSSQNTSVVLKEYNDMGLAPMVPISDYRIKGTIVPWDDPNNPGNEMSSFEEDTANNQDARIAIRITSIEGFPPSANQTSGDRLYVIDKFIESEKLFEFKFPRFAYRWKYKDGEYSCFSPFTEIAFIPGSFDFHPKKGYNLGMTNRLKYVDIKNFYTEDMPDDVVEIDLLYKDENSPNIYVVKTISISDVVEPFPGQPMSLWWWNIYRLSSETIYAVLPSNQLLRPWDNVPRKALAQEVVGNRVVYGNYLQNFDLKEKKEGQGLTGLPFTINSINLSINEDQVQWNYPRRSIKSLREYQLGVVFTDEYGRETPVLSDSSSTMALGKTNSWKSNSFHIELANSYPANMTHFKFFIKETADEYYNMAMDRFYDAEDGNIWLAFPSSDRNKIDIDTFLILKKGLQDGEQVTESARYKVLAIENEAPDYVKTTRLKICSETHSSTTNDIFGNSMAGAPGVGDEGFSVNYAPFHMTSGSNLHNSGTDSKLYVEFGKTGSSEVSNRYEITELTLDWDGSGATLNTSKYHFKIKGDFGTDIAFISNDPTGINATQINTGARMIIYRYKVENKAQFDGRFFVKILHDDVFSKYVKKVFQQSESQYKVTASRKIYHLLQNFDKDVWDTTTDAFDPGNAMQINGATYNLHAHWKSKFKSYLQEFKFKESQTASPGNLDNFITNEFYATGGMAIAGETCEGSYGWRMYNLCLDTGSGFVLHPDYGLPNETPPASTWFIDNGNFRGTRWNNDMESNYGDISPSGAGYIAQSNSDTSLDFYGNGLDTTTLPTGWFLDLGFGGIWSKEWQWVENGSPVNGIPEIIGPTPQMSNDLDHYAKIPNFFRIGEQGGNPNHTGESDVVSLLVPGQKFRWKEDPLREDNIYEIQSVSTENRIRYRRNDELGGSTNWDSMNNPAWGGSLLVPGFHDARHNLDHQIDIYTTESTNTEFTNPANFTKNFILEAKPQIVWNPVASATTITGGYEITLTTPNPGGTASAANNITCVSCAQTDPANDFSLVFDSITALDTATNEQRQIMEGMVLTEYTNTASAVTTPPQMLIVKNITYDVSSEKYFVDLCGMDYFHKSNENFVPKENTSVVFKQPSMNGLSPSFVDNYHFVKDKQNEKLVDAIGYTIEFLEPIDNPEVMPDDPAIWETEPKESAADLDIYYEASGSIPIELTANTISNIIKSNTGNTSSVLVGLTNSNASQINVVAKPEVITGVGSIYTALEVLNTNICVQNGGCAGGTIDEITSADSIIIDSYGTKINIPIHGFTDFETIAGDTYAHTIVIKKNMYTNANYDLHWFNCYSFGNGVESNRIRDNFNLPFIRNGVKASTTLAEQYKEEHRKYGLIYSGLYNSTSGINDLNQFIQAEKITKDINPIYGSIQKLHTRDTDLVTLCEDKVLKILANKDAVFNADSNPQLIASANVLGQTIPFIGEYGISTNPESFASESYRAYFADKTRGSVMRLSRDGLTPISDHGMRDWFRDRMKLSEEINNDDDVNVVILGSYDARQQEYNISFSDRKVGQPGQEIGSNQQPLTGGSGNVWKGGRPKWDDIEKHKEPITVSFKEGAKGWVSFKSFIPEHGISANNDYFTFFNGKIWKHHTPVYGGNSLDPTIITNYNNFYGTQYNSTFTVLLNNLSSVIKSFKTLNYEGTESRVIKNIEDDQYYNLDNAKGWYVDHIFTDNEEGSIPEFIDKEGKWFNYIKGEKIQTTQKGKLVDGFEADAFAIQGLGMQTSPPVVGGIVGCMDPAAIDFDPAALVPCMGCCTYEILGCTDASATNFDPNANTDDGSCIIPGCMDSIATNYNPNATIDDGSCNYAVLGCTDQTAFNYNSNATVDDGSCYPIISGCMDNTAMNYNNNIPFANNVLIDVNTPCCTLCNGTDDNNCCTFTLLGCTDNNACNHNLLATVDDGSCVYCGDTGTDVDNNDGASCNSGCLYCRDATNFALQSAIGTTIQVGWDNPTYPSTAAQNAIITQYEYRWRIQGGAWSAWVNVNASGSTLSQTVQINNVSLNSVYEVELKSICANSFSSTQQISVNSATGILGCTDNTGANMPASTSPNNTAIGGSTSYVWGACNYNPAATIDDGSCNYISCVGCTNSLYLQYYPFNPAINTPASTTAVTLGYCSTTAIFGCTNQAAINYNAAANVDDGSCCTDLGCTDPCANNYSITACWDDGSCQYGILCDGEEFLDIQGSQDTSAPWDTAPYNSTDQNGNGIIDIYTDSMSDMWNQGPLPTQTCTWHRWHTRHDGTGTVTGGQRPPTFNGGNYGPQGFSQKGKLLFEPGDVSMGPTGNLPGGGISGSWNLGYIGAQPTSSGVYQMLDTDPGTVYQFRMVVDNFQPSGGGSSYDRPSGTVRIAICDGNNFNLQSPPAWFQNYVIQPTAVTTPAMQGCIVLDPGNGTEQFDLGLDFTPTGVTGVAQFGPDGEIWSGNPHAICPGGGAPCINPGSGIGSGYGANVAHNWNDTSQQIELTTSWTALSIKDIIYVGYGATRQFYTTYQGAIYPNVSVNPNALNSHFALEVSTLEVLETGTSGPCGVPVPNTGVA